MIEKTEDKVRDEAREILGLKKVDPKVAKADVGQITTFNQLGFPGKQDKPDGWYLPFDKNEVAVVIETKATKYTLHENHVKELVKNIKIVQEQYAKVVGILWNGDEIRVFKNLEEKVGEKTLQPLDYYLKLFNATSIDKEYIYELTAKINNCLHFDFGIKNLYHRMIFTACALVGEQYGADLMHLKGRGYQMVRMQVKTTLESYDSEPIQQDKIKILLEEYEGIKTNTTENQTAINSFIDYVVGISKYLTSNDWRGEDVMGIFFNEFNRYKKKSEAGQVFTPEHITDFMYKILDVNMNDKVLDATCGSGGFLVKAMSNMIHEAGGMETEEAKTIKSKQLFGIEFDKEVFALACANMLLHKDGKTNLEQMDARSKEACEWIASKEITKVLMNPPYENKYGCMTIVENVLDNVSRGTLCGFILPEKKLEKASKSQMKRILSHHKLKKVIKLPEDLFFGVGVTTSIFIFESGVSQNGEEFFACHMQSDGLVVVKNKGRHDVHNKWPEIEERWVKIVKRMSGDTSCQWQSPEKCLSYQTPPKPFEIYEEDFMKTALDYLLFEKNVNVGELKTVLMNKVLYGSDLVEADDRKMTIQIDKTGEDVNAKD